MLAAITGKDNYPTARWN